MHLYPIDGAAGRGRERCDRRESTGTRNGPRSSSASAPIRRTMRVMTAWARAYWEAMHPYSAGGAYVNFMMDEGDERIRATYGGNTIGSLP